MLPVTFTDRRLAAAASLPGANLPSAFRGQETITGSHFGNRTMNIQMFFTNNIIKS